MVVDTLICGAVAFAAPLPQFDAEQVQSIKEIPVAVHIFDDTLDVVGVFNEVASDFAPLNFILQLDTITFHSTQGHSWTEHYNDSTVMPPLHYGVMTEICEGLHIDGHMNVYVMPLLATGIAGFSFIPPFVYGNDRHPADGVWIRSSYFDSTTLHHEIGHFLGLYHVFQGVDFCGQNADMHDVFGYSYGDLVPDTPPIKITGHCLNPTCVPAWPNFRPWANYVHNNFMDYMPSFCRTSFTPGQVARMHSYMTAYRPQEYVEAGYSVGDINNDGIIGTLDLLFLLSCLGTPVSIECAPADFDMNNAVTVFDLLVLLTNYQQ